MVFFLIMTSREKHKIGVYHKVPQWQRHLLFLFTFWSELRWWSPSCLILFSNFLQKWFPLYLVGHELLYLSLSGKICTWCYHAPLTWQWTPSLGAVQWWPSTCWNCSWWCPWSYYTKTACPNNIVWVQSGVILKVAISKLLLLLFSAMNTVCSFTFPLTYL